MKRTGVASDAGEEEAEADESEGIRGGANERGKGEDEPAGDGEGIEAENEKGEGLTVSGGGVQERQEARALANGICEEMREGKDGSLDSMLKVPNQAEEAGVERGCER